MKPGAHLSPEELALFAESSPALDAALEQHLAACEECSIAVVSHLETLSAEELGIPATVSEPTEKSPAKATAKSSNPFSGLFAGLASGLFLTLGHDHVPLEPNLAGSDISHPHDVINPPAEVSTREPGGGMHSHSEGYSDAPKLIGLHGSQEVSRYVHQGYADTCAIQCQHLILNQFGIPVTETQLVKEAIADHIYTPGRGTNPAYAGRLLEDHGLPVHRYANANIMNLAVELGQGHKVIVGVESGSLWHTNTVFEDIRSFFGLGAADHAVIVSGINTENWPHATVIVTDPGDGSVAREYPLDDFLAAWRGSHFSMVATADPAPPSLPEMAHFDYAEGHIPEIGGVPFEFAAQLAQQASHESDPAVLSRMDEGFLSLVHGHAGLDAYAGALHSQTDFPHAVSDFASAAHHSPFDHSGEHPPFDHAHHDHTPADLHPQGSGFGYPDHHDSNDPDAGPGFFGGDIDDHHS